MKSLFHELIYYKTTKPINMPAIPYFSQGSTYAPGASTFIFEYNKKCIVSVQKSLPKSLPKPIPKPDYKKKALIHRSPSWNALSEWGKSWS
jgi:hypothetical protein